MLLKDKVAMITGSGRGIGKAIAMKFAEEGAKLVLTDVRPEILEQTGKEIEQKFGTKPLCLTFDVRNAQQIDEAAKKTLDTFSRIDILVNNAGITRDQLLAMMSEQDWDDVLSINLKSVFLCTKTIGKLMIRQRYGRIINMASVVGVMGNAGQANYAASKGGVIAFTKTVAKELAKRNITANAIAPGFIDTDMTKAIPEKFLEQMKSAIPLARLGLPEDIANLALFLASDLSSYITGQVIHVDGGMVM
jgi:3-oxoacyl-[acyl-carrier protein] reductase